jgi:hypothetical protein
MTPANQQINQPTQTVSMYDRTEKIPVLIDYLLARFQTQQGYIVVSKVASQSRRDRGRPDASAGAFFCCIPVREKPFVLF